MKLNYYEETDSLYIDLSLKESVETKEISPGVNLDYDNHGNVVGIDNASKNLILNHIPSQVHILA